MKRLPLLVLFGLLLPAGCSGKKPPPDPVSVKGTVLGMDGKPLTGQKLVLIFNPQDESNKKGKLPNPVVDEKTGTFSDMAVPGRYKVTLAPIVRGGGGGPAGGAGGGASGAPAELKNLPASVLDPQQSKWEVDVPAEGLDNIKLTMPAK